MVITAEIFFDQKWEITEKSVIGHIFIFWKIYRFILQSHTKLSIGLVLSQTWSHFTLTALMTSVRDDSHFNYDKIGWESPGETGLDHGCCLPLTTPCCKSHTCPYLYHISQRFSTAVLKFQNSHWGRGTGGRKIKAWRESGSSWGRDGAVACKPWDWNGDWVGRRVSDNPILRGSTALLIHICWGSHWDPRTIFLVSSFTYRISQFWGAKFVII